MKKSFGRFHLTRINNGNASQENLRQPTGLVVFFLLLLSLLFTLSACQAAEATPNAISTTNSNENLFIETEIKPVSEITPTPEPTPPNADLSPTLTPLPTELADYGIIWSTGFESGNLNDYYETHGEFIHQSTYGSYTIVNDPVLNGTHAAALTIDTQSLASGRAAAAYLFYYKNPDAGWYSAWIFIPEDTQPLSWWNIWQWKSTFNGNSDQSVPLWILDLTAIPSRDDLQLTLVYRPDNSALRRSYTNPTATVNKGEWVHLSTYYQKSMDSDGIVAVWLNGEEVYRVENVKTAETDNTLYWSINHYSETILPHPSTIYVDDVIISSERIEQTFRLP